MGGGKRMERGRERGGRDEKIRVNIRRR